MKAETVAVGTELLLGQIADTNAQHISQALARSGVGVYFHSVVGDNLERMVSVLRQAWERSDVVIVTGGLGPTPDDITREGVAEAFGRPIERDEEMAVLISEIFARLGREMPEGNLRQADLPKGAVTISPEGTAPGFYVEEDDKLLFSLPGVPWEMKAMLTKTVLPMLRDRLGDATILSREVLVLGLGESHTHERIKDLVDAQTNPTIAYRAGGGRVSLRLTAKASSEAEAIALIRPLEEQIRARLGDAAVEGDHDDLAWAFGELLRERGITVGVVESLTGGLIGAELTSASGSGDYFLGSLVCYATEAKRDIAGVDEAILMGPGPVSEEAAVALAEAAALRFGADLGLAATGVAGPSEQDGHPVGTVFVAAAFGGRTEVRKVRGYGDRSNIRAFAVSAAIDIGRRLILATK